MPERPLLLFPVPTDVARANETGRGLPVVPLTPQRQRERLERKFAEIAQGFRDVAPRIDGFEPEHVIVLEAAGDLTDVAKAADRIPGLEWLREADLAELDQDEDFRIRGDDEAAVPQRLFALMSTQQAIEQLLGLWNEWQENPDRRARTGFGPFKSLFTTLRDVRRWGVKDRLIDTGIEQYWEDLSLRGEPVRFEAELWYRGAPAARAAASLAVEGVVEESGGRKIDEASIEEIRYHALLLECPAETIAAALAALQQEEAVALLRCEEIMFFRPVAQAVLPAAPPLGDVARAAVDAPLPQGAPIVAILDGVPLEQHAALSGRLVIDDPDDFAASYLAAYRQHGTAMASLIVHGESPREGKALTRPVYLRPVMKLEANGFGQRFEQFPSDRLFLDVFYRAIRRMMEGEAGGAAVAPTVRIVNVSLGNHWQPFHREVSPLAKLLDWLAWHYGLLFIVSAGNFLDRIVLEIDGVGYDRLTDRDAIACALRSMRDSRHARRLISPAESVNALTVGAVHWDQAGQFEPGARVDLMRNQPYPSPITRLGLGVNRGVKPEVLNSGGRQLYSRIHGPPDQNLEFDLDPSVLAPGTLAAAASTLAGDRSAFTYSCGTSNAAALTTRLACLINEKLEAAYTAAGIAPDYSLFSVMTKALLVHSASWADPQELVASLCAPGANWQERKRTQSELMGFGVIVVDRALVATDQRVLLVGCGRLSADQAHRFSFPLPDAISGQPWRRRLVATLAWLTPLHFRHRNYRRAKLFLTGEAIGDIFGPATDADDKLAGRGTVQHLVRQKEERRVFDEDFALDLQVNCRSDAGSEATDIPYGFAATLEIAAPIEVNIYDAIQTRIRERVRIPPL